MLVNQVLVEQELWIGIQVPKTATFTAVSGDGFFANTTAGAFNMNLPAGVAGAIVSVADYAGTWQNKCFNS